jgi:Flp pilus assembly CpaE family ATPase
VGLELVLGRTGQLWEQALLAEAETLGVPTAQCRNVVELLVTAEVEVPDFIVISEDFPRLTEVLSRLRGLTPVVVVGTRGSADCRPERATLASLRAAFDLAAADGGRVVAVWCPPGSWGATTVALGIARDLARDASTVLVDANVHAPGVADVLDLPLGGLLHACLAADRGTPEIPVVDDAGLAVLTGLDPALYPAAHPGALNHVLDLARARYRHVVVDVDSAVDGAGEIGLVPDWTTATAVCLQAADDVVVVVGESHVSQLRLWRALPAVADLVRGRTTVVVNRCRDARRSTAAIAQRLGDYLPEAAVGWVGEPLSGQALAPIVAELVAEPRRATR